MAGVINSRFARVKEAVTRPGSSTADAERLGKLWDDVLPGFAVSRGTYSLDRWLRIQSSDIIPELLVVLKRAIDYDTNGVSSCHAIEFTVARVDDAMNALQQLHGVRGAAAASFLDDIVVSTPTIITTWWNKFRYMRSTWLQTGDLTVKIRGFLILYTLCYYYGSATTQSPDYSSPVLRKYPDLHDFLLFAGICLEWRPEIEPALVLAVELATRFPLPNNTPDSLPSVREHLKSQPLAILSRLEVILLQNDQEERFDIVITALQCLAYNFNSFLKHDDLACAIASSYWALVATRPRGVQKDWMTYKAIMVISLLSIETKKLLSQYDLLALTEKAIIAQVTTLSNEELSSWNHIGDTLMFDPEALRSPLRRDFLLMLDYLRTIHTPPGRHLLHLWLHLGQRTGVSELELRKELNQKRKAARNGLIGCTWYKCAMYEQDSVEVTYMCAGCHRATYCGPDCQDRDWRQGGHAAKCKEDGVAAPAAR